MIFLFLKTKQSLQLPIMRFKIRLRNASVLSIFKLCLSDIGHLFLHKMSYREYFHCLRILVCVVNLFSLQLHVLRHRSPASLILKCLVNFGWRLSFHLLLSEDRSYYLGWLDLQWGLFPNNNLNFLGNLWLIYGIRAFVNFSLWRFDYAQTF